MSPSRPNTRAGLKSKSGSWDRKRGILFLVVQRKLEAGRKSSQHTSQSSLLTSEFTGLRGFLRRYGGMISWASVPTRKETK